MIKHAQGQEASAEVAVLMFRVKKVACNEDWITIKSIHVIAQGIPLAEAY